MADSTNNSPIEYSVLSNYIFECRGTRRSDVEETMKKMKGREPSPIQGEGR